MLAPPVVTGRISRKYGGRLQMPQSINQHAQLHPPRGSLPGCCRRGIGSTPRRRIKTEEKAKVLTAVWKTELIQFLAALAILNQDDLKKGMNHPILHIVLVQFILFLISSWCNSSYSSNYPGARNYPAARN